MDYLLKIPRSFFPYGGARGDKGVDLVRQHQDYRELFSSELGKRVLADIANRECHCSETGFNKDPHQTAYNLGKKHVVQHILNVLTLDVEQVKETDR